MAFRSHNLGTSFLPSGEPPWRPHTELKRLARCVFALPKFLESSVVLQFQVLFARQQQVHQLVFALHSAKASTSVTSLEPLRSFSQQSVDDGVRPRKGSCLVAVHIPVAMGTGKAHAEDASPRSHAAEEHQNDVPPGESAASSQSPHGSIAKEDYGHNEAVCSAGLRLAFDCALKRVIALGVRDHLIDKYKLPMVPLDVCQGAGLLDVEQCIPADFIEAFPFDTLLEVVRQRRLVVGTMVLSVFPQLAADQSNTSGFYPELVQAIARELTVIVLQNAGLRRKLIGDRQLNSGILDQPFSKRVRDLKATTARKWRYGESCGGKSSISVERLSQLPVSAASGHVASSSDAFAKKDSSQSAPGLLFGASSSGASACQFDGALLPWESIPKDVFIAVSHVKFSTPLNLIAAVYRGEVHMTDVGMVASAYLPEKYNFLPLGEVLEPSCSIGAWKSFFLLRDPASKRRRDRHSTSSDVEQTVHTRSVSHEDKRGRFASNLPTAGSFGSDQGFWREFAAEDVAGEGRLPVGLSDSQYWGMLGLLESWEEQMSQTRKLFFKLFGVQSEDASAANEQNQGPATNATADSSGGPSASRGAEEETTYEDKTLVKLHHVDHFTFSYLFPEDFRICSVRKLTDLWSLLSDGEPIGAFGYGLAGRGGRQQTLSGSKWHCPPQTAGSQRLLGSKWRRDALMSVMSLRKSACDAHAMARRKARSEDGLPELLEFPGPLVPLAAFFAKSRDPACRAHRKQSVSTVVKQVASVPSAAELKVLSSGIVFVSLIVAILCSV
ncbi:hypothetical protein Efla_005423 [Eimeria flavescens]